MFTKVSILVSKKHDIHHVNMIKEELNKVAKD